MKGNRYRILGSSQAMKTAWMEDLLGLVAPISFLIASKVAIGRPNKKFPFGYHRANSIAYLVGAVSHYLRSNEVAFGKKTS